MTEFVPRTSGVWSGDSLSLWTNGEVRALYAELEWLRAALTEITGLSHNGLLAAAAARKALDRDKQG